MHAGDPCPGETTCNEADSTCDGCVTDADCPSDTEGAWGTCGAFAGTCGETGMRTRTVTSYRCLTASCVPAERSESEACTRSTSGDSCGMASTGSWGSCGSYAGTCDESGTRTRTITHRTCASGACTDDPRTDMGACSRSTVGVSCGASSPGAWGACGGFTGTCGEAGSRSRSVTDRVCSTGACRDSARTESGSCSRETDGNSCGTTVTGTWGSCGSFASRCDESGTQSRMSSSFACAAGSCATASMTETRACLRETDGSACGSTSYGSWSRCSGFTDVCDESGSQTRSVSVPVCTAGSCSSVTSTETRSCSRSTTGSRCIDSVGCDWSTCSGGSCRTTTPCTGICCELTICVPRGGACP